MELIIGSEQKNTMNERLDLDVILIEKNKKPPQRWLIMAGITTGRRC